MLGASPAPSEPATSGFVAMAAGVCQTRRQLQRASGATATDAALAAESSGPLLFATRGAEGTASSGGGARAENGRLGGEILGLLAWLDAVTASPIFRARSRSAAVTRRTREALHASLPGPALGNCLIRPGDALG